MAELHGPSILNNGAPQRNMAKEMKRTKGTISKSIPQNSPLRFQMFYTGTEREKWIKIAKNKITKEKKKFEIFYYAAFYYGGDDLRIYPVVSSPSYEVEVIVPYSSDFDRLKLIQVDEFTTLVGNGLDEPWRIFFDCASFADISNSLSGQYTLTNIPKEDMKKALELSLNADDRYNIFASDKALLKLIRDKPRTLNTFEARVRFIEILTLARWGVDKGRKKAAKLLLRDCLIPQDAGGEKQLLPDVDYKLAYALMLRLANYLSSTCKRILVDAGYDEKFDLIFTKKNSESYNILIDELKKTFPYSYRLYTLSTDALTVLVNKPSFYAEGILKDQLGISKKTLTRRTSNK